ncbi:MAG: SDR family oxidoreductase [Bacteroidota bacterium]
MAKTILITGASSGIGKSAARLFQQKGWNVIATMRSPDKETELIDLENVLVTRLDVLDIASIEQAVEEGQKQFGQIDALLNNAGYGAYGPLEVFDRASIQRQFQTNVLGLLDVTRTVIPHFRAQQSGVIINISSMGGRITFPLGSLYHGTKFAVEGISEALSFEMAQAGVRVKVVEPGLTATDFGGRSFDFQNDETLQAYQPLIKALFEGFEKMSGLASTPELVAEVIYEAATDESPRLRYRVGPDTEQLLSDRDKLGEEAFLAQQKALYGL